MNSNDSDEEMFPFNPEYSTPFAYNDPVLVEGVLGAVLESDLGKLISLVDSGKSLNINDNNGNTALHYAACKNNMDIIKYILDQDHTLINTKNEFGETPLSVASLNGRYEAVKMLIDFGGDVNNQEKDGTAPLHNTVSCPKLTHLLLSNGADVNILDFFSNTPLHLAVEKESLETIYVLLYYGADVNAINHFGYNPFMKALASSNIEIQEVLLDYVDDFNTTSNWSTLHIALRYRSPYYEEIVRRGAIVDNQALIACIDIPNINHFRFVWNNLQKLELAPNENGILLKLFTLWNRNLLSPYVDIILDYSNGAVLQALAMETFGCDYHYIIYEYKDTLSLDQITKLTLLLLGYGMTLNADVITAIFNCYGQCKLLEYLMYMDFDGSWPDSSVTPRLIFDIEYDLQKVHQEIKSNQWYWNSRDLHTFRTFWTYTPILQFAKIAFENTLTKDFFPGNSSPPNVPSLLQLARDETRKCIINTFKMKCMRQYYTYVNSMDISTTYKRILKY
ncbi:uncharacterized protein LOC130451356 isoform X2 [Diorhabda sublineata]|uniref:uncharacterized protein LOC130451356 isoform X2 n=1 Tax=Diorhabda sublineata TaxID=1163346 RepID=UPI0024E117F8|nr:uncharacterized protein LOC130451356 isoform X2 [Diorhabda sublineata]